MKRTWMIAAIFLSLTLALSACGKPQETTRGETAGNPAAQTSGISSEVKKEAVLMSLSAKEYQALADKKDQEPYFAFREEDGSFTVLFPYDETGSLKRIFGAQKMQTMQTMQTGSELLDGSVLVLQLDGTFYDYLPSTGLLGLAASNLHALLSPEDRLSVKTLLEAGFGDDRRTACGLVDYREGVTKEKAAELGFAVVNAETGTLDAGMDRLEDFFRETERGEEARLFILEYSGNETAVKRLRYDKANYVLDRYVRDGNRNWQYESTACPLLTADSTPFEDGVITLLFLSASGKATAERYLQREALQDRTSPAYTCDAAVWENTELLLRFVSGDFPQLEGLGTEADPDFCPLPFGVWQPCETVALGISRMEEDNWTKLPGVTVENGVLTLHFPGEETVLNGRWTIFDKMSSDGRVNFEDLYYSGEQEPMIDRSKWDAQESETVFVWRFEARRELSAEDYVDYILYFVCEYDGETKLLWVEQGLDPASFARLPRIRGLYVAGEDLMQIPEGTYSSVEMPARGTANEPYWSASDFESLSLKADGSAVLSDRRFKGALPESFELWNGDMTYELKHCSSAWELTDRKQGKESWIADFAAKSLCVYRTAAPGKDGLTEFLYVVPMKNGALYFVHMTLTDGTHTELQAIYRLR